MARWVEFKSLGISAVIDDAPGGGAKNDPAADRNRPAVDPDNWIGYVHWHSDWFQYEVAQGPTDVTVSHSLVAGATTVLRSFTNFSMSRLGQSVAATHTLLTHSLGYVPEYMVAYSGALLTTGTNVQPLPLKGRHVCAYATDTIIGLRELGNSASDDLPACSRTYKVIVFNTPASDPTKNQFNRDGATGNATFGKAKIDTSKKYFRRVAPAESSIDLNMGATMDFTNGSVKVVSGGNAYSDYFYDGSFIGPDYVPIGGVL